jgi:hypothetical protein
MPNYNELFNSIGQPNQVTFLSIKNHTNQYGETSERLIVVGADYKKACEKDHKLLLAGVPYIPSTNYTQADWDRAMAEKIQSLENTLQGRENNRSRAQKEAYTALNGAFKWHNDFEEVYIWGVSVKKTVLVQGEYPTVNSSSKTLAKRKIEEMYCKSSKFRLFKMPRINGFLKTGGRTFEIEW